MKIVEFIPRYLYNDVEKDTWCASVMKSTDGNFYSYGYHYPLLFRVNHIWITNIQGYSSTTRKHISWARPYATFSVDLSFAKSKDAKLAVRVKSAIIWELRSRYKELNSCNPRANVKRKKLENRIKSLESLMDCLSYKN